jgi:hypothetical protein
MQPSDHSLNLIRGCVEVPVLFYLGKNSSDPDFGTASSGESCDLMTPDPVCP